MLVNLYTWEFNGLTPGVNLVFNHVVDASKFLQWSLKIRETYFTLHVLKAVYYFAVQHLSHQLFSVVTSVVSKADYKQEIKKWRNKAKAMPQNEMTAEYDSVFQVVSQ